MGIGRALATALLACVWMAQNVAAEPVGRAPSATQAADDPAALALEAIARNPGLEALRAQTLELRALATAAGTWQDPTLGIEYANAPIDSFRLDERPQSALVIGLRQTVPPWGWSELRERVARRRTTTSEHAVAEAASQLRHEVFALFHRLTLSRQLAELTREHLARAEELLDAAAARYATGSGRQHEVLRLEVLRDRLADDLSEFARADLELSAGLARAIGRDPGATFTTPPRLLPLAPTGTPDAWLSRARASRPELARLAQSARTAEAAAELAALEARPDMTFSLAYRVRTLDIPIDDGTDQVTALISVPIPLGSAARSRAEETAQQQAARRERARYAAQLDRIEEELLGIHARWTRAHDKARTYGGALAPRARDALTSVLADYAVDRTDFETVIQAELDLIEIERGWLQAAADTHIEAARLDATLGAPATEDPR